MSTALYTQSLPAANTVLPRNKQPVTLGEVEEAVQSEQRAGRAIHRKSEQKLIMLMSVFQQQTDTPLCMQNVQILEENNNKEEKTTPTLTVVQVKYLLMYICESHLLI